MQVYLKGRWLKRKIIPGINNRGLAMLEAFFIMWVMFIFMAVVLGSWGLAHTAVLHSISARNYSFFLFNNRSDLSYLRDFSADTSGYRTLTQVNSNKYHREDVSDGLGYRFAYIQSDKDPLPSGSVSGMYATLRRVDFRPTPQYRSNRSGFLNVGEHNQIFTVIPDRNRRKKVGPAWIMVGYGICLSAKCGD